MECICGCVSPSVGIAYVGVRDLDQKAWKVSLLRSTRLEKAKNKQAAFMVALSYMNGCLFGFGRNLYHHWGTSSKKVLAFCKTKLQVVFIIPQIKITLIMAITYLTKAYSWF